MVTMSQDDGTRDSVTDDFVQSLSDPTDDDHVMCRLIGMGFPLPLGVDDDDPRVKEIVGRLRKKFGGAQGQEAEITNKTCEGDPSKEGGPMIPTIPEGDFYDCGDGEQLSHESPEEAVEDWLEGWLEPDCDVSAAIREQAPIELTVFRRNALEAGWVERQAEMALETLEESFSEEYGDPEAGLSDSQFERAKKECLPALTKAFQDFISQFEVWRCDPIAKVILDADQIEEMMRAYNPDWWTDAKSLGAQP